MIIDICVDAAVATSAGDLAKGCGGEEKRGEYEGSMQSRVPDGEEG